MTKDIAQDHTQSTGMQKIVIKVEDIIEFLDPSMDSFDGQGFGRVTAIMVHEWMVFLVIVWIIPTGQTHPWLPLYVVLQINQFKSNFDLNFTRFNQIFTLISHLSK